MTWQVLSRPEAENDVIEIAAWYDSRRESLGDRFVEEFLAVLDELTINPLLHCQRHPHKNIRWRYPKSFSVQSDLRGTRAGEDGCSCCRAARCEARPRVETTILIAGLRQLIRRAGRRE